MLHVPELGIICGFILTFIVLASGSALFHSHTSTEDCSPGHVKCPCGKHGRTEVAVRRCKRFDNYSEYCDYCQSPKKTRRRLCPKFKHCQSCNSKRCTSCPPNKTGKYCRKDCSSYCFNGGTCRNLTCTCKEGFTGTRCQDINVKECFIVTKPAHGNVTVQSQTATYTCAPGYKLVGEKILTCNSNGSWSSEAPVCEALCITPNASEHRFFTIEDLFEEDEHLGSVMKLGARCEDGYRLVGARAIYCSSDGTWSSVPYCERRGRCSHPASIKHGAYEVFTHIDEYYYEGTEVTYECDLGYVLNGSFSLVCKENGEWSHNTPKCVSETSSPIDCTMPNLTHGSIVLGFESKTNRIVPGVRAVYSCDEGYILHPMQPNRFCSHDGTWVPSREPQCVAVTTCPDPGYPEHGKRCFGVEGCSSSSEPATFTSSCVSRVKTGDETIILPEGNYPNGTYVEFTCSSVFRSLEGSKFRRCGPDGTWTNENPKCIAKCGQVPEGFAGMISNAPESLVENWPWHVIVRRVNDGWFCGGVLLGDSWVVTAAHCVTVSDKETKSMNASNLRAEFGMQKLNDSYDSPRVQVRHVSKIHIHQDYTPVNLDSDIALLKLSKHVTISEYVKPVCLTNHLPDNTACRKVTKSNKSEMLDPCRDSNGNDNTPNRSDRIQAHISGFGRTSSKNPNYSQTLRSAPVSIETNTTKCMELLQAEGVTTQMTDNMFCAGKTSHPCSGDSGGPLVTKQKDHRDIYRWYLQGIVSWGSRNACRTVDSYGVFTKVSKFYDWIQRKTTPDLVHYK